MKKFQSNGFEELNIATHADGQHSEWYWRREQAEPAVANPAPAGEMAGHDKNKPGDDEGGGFRKIPDSSALSRE